jgi:hypothetical protein
MFPLQSAQSRYSTATPLMYVCVCVLLEDASLVYLKNKNSSLIFLTIKSNAITDFVGSGKGLEKW